MIAPEGREAVGAYLHLHGGDRVAAVHVEAIHGYNMFPLRLTTASRAQQYAFLNAALGG